LTRARRSVPAPVAGLVALALTAAGLYLAFAKQVPFVHHYTVRAQFRDASTLRPGSPVRVAGVNVGTVTDVRSAHPGTRLATVTMRIDDAGRPVHRDARAAIRERTQLEGNEFVDLEPGTPAQPAMPDGGTIPVSATSAPVQLDQVLDALDAPTRRALIKTLDQYGRGLAGRGARGFNASIRYWQRAYGGSAVAGDATLGPHPHSLSTYVDAAGRVAGALDRDPAAVRQLLARFDATAASFDAQRGALGATIRELPATLTTGRAALADVRAALPPVDRLAVAAGPAVRGGVPTIRAATPFLAQLQGLVAPAELQGLAHDLAPTTAGLAQLEQRLVPLMGGVREASSCQNRVILPWSRQTLPDRQFKPGGPIYAEAVKGTLPGLAGESRSGDGNGQWFTPLIVGGTNVIALGDDNFAATALPVDGVNPQEAQVRPPLRPGVPCETQTLPDLHSTPGGPPRQFQVSFDTPEAKARLVKARAVAIDWLKGRLKQEGLDGVLKVAGTDLTPDMLSKLPPTSPQFLHGIIRRHP
jgi:virulence factor Mce-like protein